MAHYDDEVAFVDALNGISALIKQKLGNKQLSEVDELNCLWQEICDELGIKPLEKQQLKQGGKTVQNTTWREKVLSPKEFLVKG